MPSRDHLQLAETQLSRVQVASWDPVDWADIAMYGLYSLENAVVAVAEHLDREWHKNHFQKADLADELASEGLVPAVGQLMRHLNAVRKTEASGEPPVSTEWDPQDVAEAIEAFIDACKRGVRSSHE